MKKLLFFSLIFIASNVYSQRVNVTDYDVPVSRAKTFRLNGAYNWAQTSTDTTTTVQANNASATIFFRSFYSSLPYAWFIDIDASGGKNFDQYNHSVSIRPSIRKYVWEDKSWFGFGELDISHRKSFKQIRSRLRVGGGYGRYINATALAKAVRIEEHLLRDNIISGHIQKELMINIAHIIEREEEYRNIYGDTYEVNWYEDIEKEFQKSEMLKDETIGAIGILRTQQVLNEINEIVNDRYYGWDVTLGILFNISNADKSPPDEPALSLGGRYSYPITWRTQINAFADVNTPMDSSFFKEVFSRVGIDFIYEFSNRINFVSGYRLDYVKETGTDYYTINNLSSSFIFYLENRINLSIDGILFYDGQTERTDMKMTVGLQYNLF